MTDSMNQLSRRVFGGSIIALGALTATRVAAAELDPTPTQTIGPFYPIERLAEEDADLTWVKGHKKRVVGQFEITRNTMSSETSLSVPYSQHD
jgi:protocatechuate 3,4-dioxygenase, beta subunit